MWDNFELAHRTSAQCAVFAPLRHRTTGKRILAGALHANVRAAAHTRSRIACSTHVRGLHSTIAGVTHVCCGVNCAGSDSAGAGGRPEACEPGGCRGYGVCPAHVGVR